MENILDKLFVILFVTVAAILIIAIIALPTVLAYLLYRWLSKKKAKFIGITLLIIAPLWTIFEVYTAIYPRDSFYFSEFKYVTLREVPKSATIIKKDASYPDFHGDYCSASLISLSDKDYNSLLNDITVDYRLNQIKPDDIIGSDEFESVMGGYSKEKIVQSFTRSIPGKEDHYLLIAFLNDKKTILINVCIS